MNLTETINWVSQIHDKQYRKGTNIPYISHVFGVAMLLKGIEQCELSVIQAALLHDTVEDTNTTLKDIEEKFGEEVANYVDQLSEDKSRSWEDRKQYAIKHLKEIPIEAKWIKLADKINSLEMMHIELSTTGIDWDKFNRGYIHQKWFYCRFFQEIKKDPVVSKSMLFKYGIKLLEKVFEVKLGTRVGYRKIKEEPIGISLDSANDTFKFLIKKWTKLARKTNSSHISWYVKQASIIFKYDGIAYGLYPGTIEASSELFECIKEDIIDDLIAFGAMDIFYTGMLD